MQPESLVTLKLDASYRPIEVIKALEALVLCLIGKAKAIEEHETQIRSPTKTFKTDLEFFVTRSGGICTLSGDKKCLNLVTLHLPQFLLRSKSFASSNRTKSF